MGAKVHIWKQQWKRRCILSVDLHVDSTPDKTARLAFLCRLLWFSRDINRTSSVCQEASAHIIQVWEGSAVLLLRQTHATTTEGWWPVAILAEQEETLYCLQLLSTWHLAFFALPSRVQIQPNGTIPSPTRLVQSCLKGWSCRRKQPDANILLVTCQQDREWRTQSFCYSWPIPSLLNPNEEFLFHQ